MNFIHTYFNSKSRKVVPQINSISIGRLKNYKKYAKKYY